jgi:hypothetical protein
MRTRRHLSGGRCVREPLGIHNQDGAKRGSARGKPLEKPHAIASAVVRSETLAVPEGSRSTLQFVKLERGRELLLEEGSAEDRHRDLLGMTRNRPRRIGVPLGGTPQNQKILCPKALLVQARVR